MSPVLPRTRRLSSQILLAQMLILSVSMAVGFVLFVRSARAYLDQEFRQRAASVAETVSAIPDIRQCMADERPGCARTIQEIATTIQQRTGASYVVVIDMQRVRHSHPNPALIGKKVSEPIVTVDGKVHLRVDPGSTGRSANARAPLYGLDGAMVGEISVGLRESSVANALWTELPTYLTWFGIALGAGVAASWALARRLKRRTFGLELHEIARLFQEREATLHGIREGVIAVDPHGLISVVNDEATRLLRLPPSAPGSALERLLPEGRLREVLTRDGICSDEVVITDDHCLLINRMPVTLAGRPHGSVITLRDRTAIEAVLQELDGERRLTESLRAQHHEFANRLHAIRGLLELDHADDALQYVVEIQGVSTDFDRVLRTHIAAPQIIGLMLGKAAEASERGIELTIDERTSLGEDADHLQAVTTVVGNLIDNAFDALATVSTPRKVRLRITATASELTVTVSDNGPGLPAGQEADVFKAGYTTKAQTTDRQRGLGLALVERVVSRLDGSITVGPGPGTTISVRLPQNLDRTAYAGLPR